MKPGDTVYTEDEIRKAIKSIWDVREPGSTKLIERLRLQRNAEPIEPERCPTCGSPNKEWMDDALGCHEDAGYNKWHDEITHPTIMDRTLWWEDNFCWGTVSAYHKYGDGYRTSHAGWKPKSWFQGRAHTKTPPEAKGEEVTG